MKPCSFRPFRFGIFVLLIIVLSCPFPCHAQDPVVTLTIFMLKETEACRKYGYQNYDSEDQEEPVCQKWTVEEIKKLLRKCAMVIAKFPPAPPQSKVSLGNLFDAVSAYRDSKPQTQTPAGRKAMMMVFTWDPPVRGDISLERTGGRSIPSKTWHGYLNGIDPTWIHHERADSFLPAYAVTWTLTIGENQWEFKAVHSKDETRR